MVETLENLTVKHGHFFTDGEETIQKMYDELEGYNLVQLFSLGNGQGSKNALKKCQQFDEKMSKKRTLELIKRSMDETSDDEFLHLDSKSQKVSIETQS